jgi:hypothetical protein
MASLVVGGKAKKGSTSYEVKVVRIDTVTFSYQSLLLRRCRFSSMFVVMAMPSVVRRRLARLQHI